jgi:hypothetical protein
MSKASEALDVLRAAGLKVSTRREQIERLHETMQDKDPDLDSDLRGPSINYEYAEEHPVCSITVEKTNYDGIRLELVSINKSEERLKETIDMLVEAICMLRDEIGQIRLEKLRDDCPF